MSKIKCRRRYLREKVFAEYQTNIKRASAYLENPVGKYNGFDGWRAKHEAKEDLKFFRIAIRNHYRAKRGEEPEYPEPYKKLCVLINKTLNTMTSRALADATGINYGIVTQLSSARIPNGWLLQHTPEWYEMLVSYLRKEKPELL